MTRNGQTHPGSVAHLQRAQRSNDIMPTSLCAELILPMRRLATDGLEAWEVAKERGYEGLVAKDEASPYQAGESRSWLKIKVRQDGRFLVGGVGETVDGSPRLFLGEEVEGELVYRGTVELGVGSGLVGELLKRGRPRRSSPFEGFRSRKITWLEPTVAVEVVTYGRLQQGWLREPAWALTCWPYRNTALRDDGRTHPRALRRSPKGGRPRYTAGPRRRGKPKHSHRGHPVPGPRKRRSQAVRERKTSVLRACRVPNPATRLNVVQGPKPLFEPQRSVTSRS